MRAVVLIPTYMRPEFLSLCLEYLSKADGARDGKEYWIFHDLRENDVHRYSMEMRWVKEVIEKSPLPVRYVERKPHLFAGNSYNVLEAYKEAYESDFPYVILVEDDVLVTKDFFKWHSAIQIQEPNTMCSIGYRCSRNTEARKDISDPGAYFTTARDYASIGVAWRRERLGPIVQHATEAYYWDQTGYIKKTFPGNRFDGDFCEQDGLAMRCMWTTKSFTTWCYTPRAFHVGGYGYHRYGKRPEGQLNEKINTLRSWIYDEEKIKAAFPDFGDMEPVPLIDNKSFDELHKIQHFE